RRELLGFVLGHTRVAVLGNFGVAAVTVAVLVRSESLAALAAWASALCVFVSARALLSWRATPRLPTLERADIVRVEQRRIALIGLTGLTWGLLPWIGYDGDDAFTDFYTVAMLMGMTGG